MSHALRGRSFERAIVRGAAHYRQLGRATLTKVPTPMVTTREGYMIPGGIAGPDFLGCHGGTGRMLVVEAKESHGKALPLEHIPEHQRDTCAMYAGFGADVHLLVLFDAEGADGEAYSIAWDAVADFLRDPWRASLSLAWCRVHGLVVPLEGPPQRRIARFLDGSVHPEQADAYAIMRTDEVRCRERAALAPDVEERAETHARVTGNIDEIRARLRAACEAGVERQLRTRRKARWDR